jgi:5-formyltetrahydrofolate cyclo-ligase
MASAVWSNAGVVTLYVPIEPEVDVWPLVVAANVQRVAIPRIVDRSRGLMTFDILPARTPDSKRAEELTEGMFGIPQARLPNEVLADAIDLVIVPATAVDTEGNRLGGGAGYYDRWLEDARTNTDSPPFALGVVFAGQVVSAGSFPVEPHDQPLDGLVTEHGLTWFARQAPLG